MTFNYRLVLHLTELYAGDVDLTMVGYQYYKIFKEPTWLIRIIICWAFQQGVRYLNMTSALFNPNILGISAGC